MREKHLLLKKQLSQLGLAEGCIPANLEKWNELLEGISDVLAREEEQRKLMERSIQKSSDEMVDRWGQLRDAEQRWQLLVECVPDVIMAVNRHRSILFVNKKFNDSEREALVGLTITDLFPEGENQMFYIQLNALLDSGLTFTNDSVVSRAEGANRYHSVRTSTMNWKNNSDAGIIILTDVTEKNVLQRVLEQERAVAFQNAKMATLGEMAGGIAHEINNPLSIIQLLSKQMEELAIEGTISTEEIQRVSGKIDSTVQRISKITRGLLAFSRGNGGDPFAKERVGKLLDDTLVLCQEKIKKNSVNLELILPPEDIWIECRTVQISQVILNLIGNAIDAVENLTEKWICLEVLNRGNEIEIQITDSGNGIPTELRDKILSPFFTTKPIGKGTGLGLSVSKGIIEDHHGKLMLNTNCKNTQFVIVLPCKGQQVAA